MWSTCPRGNSWLCEFGLVYSSVYYVYISDEDMSKQIRTVMVWFILHGAESVFYCCRIKLKTVWSMNWPPFMPTNLVTRIQRRFAPLDFCIFPILLWVKKLLISGSADLLSVRWIGVLVPCLNILHPLFQWTTSGPTFSKLLRKILGRFLILGKS